MKTATLLFSITVTCLCFACCNNQTDKPTIERQLPVTFSALIDSIRAEPIGGINPLVSVEKMDSSTIRVLLTYQLRDTVKQDDWQLNLYPSFHPDFFWAPHLTPTDQHIIAQHVFRSPLLIMADI